VERRNTERKRLLLEARWASMSGRHEARVDDISLGGCFVNTYGKAELGESVDLEIQLASGQWLPLRGVVASYQPGVGFGLSFDSLTDEETVVLNDLIVNSKEREL
jgi:PilZ domain-containing protein